MKLPTPTKDKAIYQQIADYFINRIQTGVLSPGFKLPTVRAFSAENNIAQGTVNHAYDLLVQQGYVEKIQGRGTFVCNMEAETPTSKKDLAMTTIEDFLDKMTGLNFSPDEIRIFLDLKLREREGDLPLVRLGAIDCCPEALSSMAQQIAEIAHVDIHQCLLSTVLESPNSFDPGFDILVTTPTHFMQLEEKKAKELRLTKLVMAVSHRTLLKLARIPEQSKVVILCASERFSSIITNTCKNYGVLQSPPQIAYLGKKAPLTELLTQADQIILPPNYWLFASQQERDLLDEIQAKKPCIVFGYRVEKGSLLLLEEQIEEMYQTKYLDHTSE